MEDIPQKSCLLHPLEESGASEGELIKFDKDHWGQVISAKNRRSSQKRSKYLAVCDRLPETFYSEFLYHRQCYKNFTAYKNLADQPSEPCSSTSGHGALLLRSGTESLASAESTSGIFKRECIFCKKVGKRHSKPSGSSYEYLASCETLNAENNIKEAASMLQDKEMEALTAGVDFVAKEVKYHNTCKNAYIKKAERQKKEKESTDYGKIRQAHQEAFCKITHYVQSKIISARREETLVDVHKKYMDIFSESTGSDSSYPARNLMEKLQDYFKDSLVCVISSRKEGYILKTKRAQSSEIENDVSRIACYIRNEVKSASHELKSPQNLTAEDILSDYNTSPSILMKFLRILLTGDSAIADEKQERRIQSFSDDIVFAVTRGLVKPQKHILLGLGVKSMTGSKKVLNILNRLGHCISYTTAEEIETELASNIANRNSATPDGLLKIANLSTGLAFDNYDELTETLDGSNSLHDTVGIAYQNVSTKTTETVTGRKPSDNTEYIAYTAEDEDVFVTKSVWNFEDRDLAYQPPVKKKKITKSSAAKQSGTPSTSKAGLKHRTLDVQDSDIPPYVGVKPKVNQFQFHVTEIVVPSCLKQFERRDNAWMISYAFVENTPMWHGWNSVVTKDDLPSQTLTYMEPVGKPPTRLDVVQHTMNTAIRVADECHDSYIPVTYDLAIAKPALQIQSCKSPMFDRLFVCFGAFHIKLAYFKCLGYILSGSGGDHVLVESGVLALGSLNGLLKGTFYNRAKRLHPLLAVAFRIKHLEMFLLQASISIVPVMKLLQLLLNNPSPGLMNETENNEEYINFLSAYEKFTEDTLNGKHGATAQFWMQYCKLVELYQMFTRAVRISNLDLFTYSLNKMIPLFFATGHHNYARWMTLYVMKLLNIEDTHPGLKNQMQNGSFSIRRTSKAFSRCDVDLTLEQTINADAASRLTGIASLTQNFGARKRWNLLRATRSAVVGNLMVKAGLSQLEEPAQELKPSRVKRDKSDLKKILRIIDTTMNPFANPVENSVLYSIGSGKAASEEVTSELLQVQKIGEKMYTEFKTNCLTSSSRFESPIPRKVVKNFSHDAVKAKVVNKERNKIIEVKGTRDLFGRLLFLAVTTHIDLPTVFKYPLSPVPLCLGNVDGSMSSTAKSTLLHKLEGKVESTAPKSVDVLVIDAMFVIRCMTNLPLKFKEIATCILTNVCRTSATEVHLVSDTYTGTSIKGLEQDKRARCFSDCGSIAGFNITGGEQTRPRNFSAALSSSSFKTSFLRFLGNQWCDDQYCDVLGSKKLFYAIDDKCFLYFVEDGHMTRKEYKPLVSSHTEADTRMMQHVKHIHIINPKRIITVRANDTDVLVILLYHAGLNNSLTIYMDIGNSSNNSRRYIDVTLLADTLGKELCEALPGLHAFTGCDYCPSFKGKGKVRPLHIVENSSRFRRAFGELGSSTMAGDTYLVLEEFVCVLYGQNKVRDVNTARFSIFSVKYQSKDSNTPLKNIKGLEPSMLPPCQATFKQHVLRANFIANMWKSSGESNNNQLDPHGNGWTKEKGKYMLTWFTGPMVPDCLSDHIEEVSDEESDTESEAEESDDSEED